jgi:hypothetical protein
MPFGLTRMGRYIVLNTQSPEECEPMEADIGKVGPEIKGRDWMCTCPSGEHAYYIVMDGDSAEQVLSFFPPSLKIGKTRAVPLEIMHF